MKLNRDTQNIPVEVSETNDFGVEDNLHVADLMTIVSMLNQITSQAYDAHGDFSGVEDKKEVEVKLGFTHESYFDILTPTIKLERIIKNLSGSKPQWKNHAEYYSPEEVWVLSDFIHNFSFIENPYRESDQGGLYFSGRFLNEVRFVEESKYKAWSIMACDEDDFYAKNQRVVRGMHKEAFGYFLTRN